MRMIVTESSLETHEAATDEALRCLLRIPETNALDIRQYQAGDPYVAISYTWPSAWTRLHSSTHDSTTLRNGKHAASDHISAFMVMVFDQILATAKRSNDLYFWVDYVCIDQRNASEKAKQVAITDRIYSRAQWTAIILEDTELSMSEYIVLQRKGVRATDEARGHLLEHIVACLLSIYEGERGLNTQWTAKAAMPVSRARSIFQQHHIVLTMKFLRARWFSKAWCFQEMIFSRAASFYVHCTDEPTTPLKIPVGLLVDWIVRARIYTPDISQIAEPRGYIDHTRNASVGANATAWAYGVIIDLGCYNEYDRISLLQNLTRMPMAKRLAHLPDTKGREEPVSKCDVAKMLNVLAI
jgi:hypothetical protein